jgi:hypothetical protein
MHDVITDFEYQCGIFGGRSNIWLKPKHFLSVNGLEPEQTFYQHVSFNCSKIMIGLVCPTFQCGRNQDHYDSTPAASAIDKSKKLGEWGGSKLSQCAQNVGAHFCTRHNRCTVLLPLWRQVLYVCCWNTRNKCAT